MAKHAKKNKGNETVKNIVLFVITVLIVFIVLEGFIRINYDAFQNFNFEMWRYSVSVKKPVENKNISFFHKPGVSKHLYGVNLSTNSLGFRDQEYTLNKEEGTKRILVLGDSVTLGWGVIMTEIFSEVLEDMLNQGELEYEVMNAAVGNYNTEMQVHVLQEFLPLDLDGVIIGFFPNDGEKTPQVDKGLSYFFKTKLYAYPFFWDRMKRIRYLLGDMEGNYTSVVHQFYTPEYGGKERIDGAFSRLQQIADEHELDVYIVLIPQFYTEFSEYDVYYIHEFVLELCQKYGFTCIDTFDAFKNYQLADVIVSPEDAHPNALGHRIIAESIYGVMSHT